MILAAKEIEISANGADLLSRFDNFIAQGYDFEKRFVLDWDLYKGKSPNDEVKLKINL